MIDQAHDEPVDPRLVDLEVDLARCGISTHCHWTATRKADLLRIMRQQPWALDLLKARFYLTDEEIEAWRIAAQRFGQAGLKEAFVPARRAA